MNQLKLKNGRIVTKKNVDIFVDEVIADSKNKPKLIVGTDGTVRKELTFEFNLIEDHLRQRAKLYQPLVKQYADKFNLDEAMLMALIQTESSFNPSDFIRQTDPFILKPRSATSSVDISKPVSEYCVVTLT